MHGWEFILPHDVVAIWDGIADSSPDHVKILSGGDYNGISIAHPNTANGTITFEFNINLETDKDLYVLLNGAPNMFFNGA